MNQNKYRSALAVILLFVFFIGINGLVYTNIKSSAFSFLGPLQKFLWKQGNTWSNIIAGILHSKEIEIENAELRKQNLILESTLAETEKLKKENDDLRSVIGLGLRKQFKLEMAEVVSWKIESKSILINKGKRDGLFIGMPVITKEKVLVGKIENVYNGYSEVSLITKKGFSFGVKIEDGGTILGSAVGNGKREIDVGLLPYDADIKSGAEVFTALSGTVFPEDLLVGRVEKVEKEDVKAFQKAIVRPYFSESSLERVFLITLN